MPNYYGYGDIDRVISSNRVHIERIVKSGCEEFEDEAKHCEHEELEHDCDCCCEKRVDKGFDGKRDRVVIEACIDGPLKEQQKYVLVLAQPVPVDGYNLPVDLRVKSEDCDGKKVELFPLKKGPECGCRFGDLEYGQDLPRHRNRVPLYFTNGRDFIDLRRSYPL